MRYRAKARSNRERVLIVGAGQNAQHVAWLLDQPGNAQKFQVSGFVDDDLSAQGMRVSGVDVVGTWNDIPELVARQNVKVIIVADHGVTSERYQAIAEVCRAAKTTLVVMPNLVDSLSILWRGSSSTCQTGGEAKDSADSNCIQCLAKRGAACGAPLLQESHGAEVS
jgi:FlaA1/EpsC-like NDP-sugar epimerase